MLSAAPSLSAPASRALLCAAAAVGMRLQAVGAFSTTVTSTAAVQQAAQAEAAAPQEQAQEQAQEQGAAPAAPPHQKSVGKGDPADAFIFKTHCKGKRVMSEEARATRDSLLRSDFGSLKRTQGQGAAPPAATLAAGQQRHLSAEGGGASADEASQELVEKGSKRMMQDEDMRQELAQGSFDLDHTTQRVVEEGKKDASPEAAERADEEDVNDAARSRVISQSQTT